MLLDALSHSPIWKDSLLIVTEDDPQDGGDHVDLHRSVLFMASPWVKRGYVSHGHYDMASVYKLVAHVFGIPYNNDDDRERRCSPSTRSPPRRTTRRSRTSPREVTAPCNARAGSHAKRGGGLGLGRPRQPAGAEPADHGDDARAAGGARREGGAGEGAGQNSPSQYRGSIRAARRRCCRAARA